MISPFAAMCVPERTLQDRVTGHHDNDDMYMTFATHVFNNPGFGSPQEPQGCGPLALTIWSVGWYLLKDKTPSVMTVLKRCAVRPWA